jgi:hypothetical protein
MKFADLLRKLFLGSFKLKKSSDPSNPEKSEGIINELHNPNVSDAFTKHDKGVDFTE